MPRVRRAAKEVRGVDDREHATNTRSLPLY